MSLTIEDIAKAIDALDEQDVPTGKRYIAIHRAYADAALAAGVLRETDTPDVYEINL